MAAKGKDNLNPIRDTETAKALGSKGGKASGESRRRKANLRKAANEILANSKVKIKVDGKTEEVNVEQAVIMAMVKKAVNGDVGAYKALMATAGYSGKSELDEKEQKARIKKMEAEAKALEEKLKMVDGTDGSQVIIIDNILSRPISEDECQGGFPPPPWADGKEDSGEQ